MRVPHTAILLAAASATFAAFAQQLPKPAVDAAGTVTGQLPPVPVSQFLSPEMQRQLAAQLQTASPLAPDADIAARRKFSDDNGKRQLDGWLKIHPSKIEDIRIDGVRVSVVTPASGIDPKNARRVLINAHMGGFTTGGTYGGQVESVPLSGRGKIKVLAVDYRMAPEHKFPAASEDMEKVYREVLKTTKPANVGIFGCSAGGTLTGQSIAWFKAKGLPLPGAIGISCSGLMESFWFGGDSGSVTSLLNAAAARPAPAGAPSPYFEGINLKDPLVTPGLFPDVLKAFPPTLLIAGTRDIAMSNLLATHHALLKAGVDARLYLQEGLGHGHFFAFPGTPEAAATYDVMWDFFDRNLAK